MKRHVMRSMPRRMVRDFSSVEVHCTAWLALRGLLFDIPLSQMLSDTWRRLWERNHARK